MVRDCIAMSDDQPGVQSGDAAGRSSVTSPDSLEIIEALADYRGVDPLELDFALGEKIDPEALETVLDSDTEDLQVTFTIDGTTVSVADDGTIMISDSQ